ITPDRVDAFIRPLPIRKIPGVGPVLAEQIAKLGARTCGELQQVPMEVLARHFGKSSYDLYQRCRGIDDRPVEAHSECMSLSTERTFQRDLMSIGECLSMVDSLFDELQQELLKVEGR